MKTLLFKEVRLVLPFWLTALLLASAPVWLPGDKPDVIGMTLFCFEVGTVLLSVSTFGMEFSHGTFQMLLAQPIPRRTIWLVKVGILTMAMITTLWTYGLTLHWRTTGGALEAEAAGAPFIGGVMVIAGLAGGLWTTLLLRQVVGAFWFTPLVPGFLLLIVTALTGGFSPEDIVGMMPGLLVLMTYSVLGIAWAAWLFARAQDTQWTGGTITLSLPDLISNRLRAGRSASSRNRWTSLLSKELHLHQAGLMMFGCVGLFHLGVILVRIFLDPTASTRTKEIIDVIGVMVWFAWVCIPVVFGAVSVAEERRLGLAEAQLCQPVSRRVQFVIKLAFTLVLGVLCGALIPWYMLVILIGKGSGLIQSEQFNDGLLGKLVLASAGLAFLSFYASTLARNTQHALSIAAILITGSFILTPMAVNPERFLGIALWKGPLVQYIGWPVMLLTITGLAFANFRRIHEGRRTWLRNLTIIIVAIATVTAATAFTYHRTWELAMPLEPEHGSAKIQGSGKTKICEDGAGRLLVLLPDGRIWVSSEDQLYRWSEFVNPFKPTRSGFLPGSNWVDIVESGAIALRSDGSLWNLSKRLPRQPTQLALSGIGSDNDWVAVSGMAHTHYLAIKRDGTLWGWGNNRYGSLAHGLPDNVLEPIRLGYDSDWVACHAKGHKSLCVKRDGSVWQWGEDHWANGLWHTKEPVRVNLPGEGLMTLPGRRIALYADGRLLNFPADSKNQPPPALPQNQKTSKAWLDVSLGGQSLWALARGGTLWEVPQAPDPSVKHFEFRPDLAAKWGRHSDWIALEVYVDHLIALSADGTLCAWVIRDVPYPSQLLRPSRRPIANINILDDGPIPLPPSAD